MGSPSDYDVKFAKLLKAQQSQGRGKDVENEAILDVLSQVKQDIVAIKDNTSYNVMVSFDQRIRKLEKFVEKLCYEFRQK